MARVFIVLTSGTTWIAPLDCKQITVECLSGGAAFGCSSIYATLNGSYSKSNSIPVTPFQKFYYSIGSAGFSTWFNTINSVPVVGTQNSANSCIAYNLYSSATQSTQLSNSIGDYNFYGGYAYLNYQYCSCGDQYIYGGSGGAAGPDGNGGNNALKTASVTYYNGGGANGGTSANSTSAGTGPLGNIDGTNGAPANVTSLPIVNSQYIVWNDGINNYGISSGYSSDEYNLGSPGPGPGSLNLVGYGGTLKQGLIVISYVPAGPPGNSYTEVYQGNQGSNTLVNWRVPVGVTSIKVEALGAGSGPTTASFNTYSGAGGAYSSATISVLPGQIFSGSVGGTYYGAGANTTFSNLSTVLVNAGGAGINGNTAVGGVVYVGTGYPGGNGTLNSGTTSANYRTAGGGGAGGPNGPGGDGGPPYQPGGGTSGGGGGGGGAGLVGSPVTLSPSSLAANGQLYFTIPSGKTIITGTSITVSGYFGSGGLTGYSGATGSTYYIRATNGTTTANLCTTYAATQIAATATTNFGNTVFTISNRGGVGGLTGTGSSANQGGAGGSGAFRDPGGLGGTTTTSATAGTNGSGGGGGGLNASFAAGSPSSNAAIYSAAQSNTAIGFFIGGGGGGSAGSSTIRGAGGRAYYGGGASAGADNNYVYPGVGLLAITYTIPTNTNASESSMMSMF
jgi:hypothetical protein